MDLEPRPEAGGRWLDTLAARAQRVVHPAVWSYVESGSYGEVTVREAGSTRVASLLPVVDLLVESGLAKSKGEARRTITEGGAYLNNVRIEDPDAEPRTADLIGGSWLVLRRGKKSFAGVEVG